MKNLFCFWVFFHSKIILQSNCRFNRDGEGSVVRGSREHLCCPSARQKLVKLVNLARSSGKAQPQLFTHELVALLLLFTEVSLEFCLLRLRHGVSEVVTTLTLRISDSVQWRLWSSLCVLWKGILSLF